MTSKIKTNSRKMNSKSAKAKIQSNNQ